MDLSGTEWAQAGRVEAGPGRSRIDARPEPDTEP